MGYGLMLSNLHHKSVYESEIKQYNDYILLRITFRMRDSVTEGAIGQYNTYRIVYLCCHKVPNLRNMAQLR